jgi:hypothetical protein
MAWLGKPSAQDDRRAEAYRLWLGRQHPMAIVSAVLGTISLLDLGVVLVLQVAGLITGILALTQLQRIAASDAPPPARSQGRRLAWIGISLSAFSLLIAAGIYYWHPAHLHG